MRVYYNGPMEMMVHADGQQVIVTCELRERIDRSIRSGLGALASAAPSDPRLALILKPGRNREALVWDAPAPDYPDRLRRAGVAETVIVDVTVGDDGAVQGVDVVRPSMHPEFDRASIRAVWDKWRFLPAMSDGAAVPSTVRRAIKFEP